MKKIILSLSLIICLIFATGSSYIETDISSLSPSIQYITSYTYDFWIPYKDFENAIKNDLTLSASYDSNFTAEVKKIFGDIFIPFETVFPDQDPNNCEVQIFPDYGRYYYSVSDSESSENETIITFAHSYLNYSDYPGGSTPKLSSKKVDVYTFNDLKKHKEIHTEGFSNSVPYLRQYNIGKAIDLTEYNITHTLYLIYGNSMYEVRHWEVNAQLNKKEVMLLSDTDAYIDRLTSYIHDMHKESSNVIVYDENKSFKKIYNESVKQFNQRNNNSDEGNKWKTYEEKPQYQEGKIITIWFIIAAIMILAVAFIGFTIKKRHNR